MVAAWINADTGVGPAIASANHVCNGNCADFPTAPPNNIRVAKTIAEAPLHVLQLEKKVIIDLQGKNMVETVDIENKLFREILYDKQKLDDFKKSLKNYIDKLKIKI